MKYRGWVPDVVIVDYIGELKDYANMEPYLSKEQLVDELMGLASEEKFFFATALQPNRSGKEAQEKGHLGQAHMAGAFGMMRPLYGCLTLNQNDRESAMGVGRGWIEKQRNGKKHYTIYLRFDPKTLKISEISKETYTDMMTTQREKVVDEIGVDMVKDLQGNVDKKIDDHVDEAKKKFKPEEGEE